MRVLFVSPRIAWPPTSGARLRDFHFARSLSGRCTLLYLFFGTAADAAALRPQLPGTSVEALPPPRRYTPVRILRGLLGRTPLPVLNYTSAAMEHSIASTLKSSPFDVVHLESLHLAAYLPMIRRLAPVALTVLDWHNIESELMLRFAGNTQSPLKRVYARLTAGKLRNLEAELLAQCSGHLVCSARERDLLLARQPTARVAVVENGVDTARFRPAAGAPLDTPMLDTLVFVGQMSYHANVEAAIWFVREIWPAIRANHPRLTLLIVGSDPTPAVRALEVPGEITVTGTVPDVLPFYRGAFAAVVPLLTGGGTRLKILEAMAAGTPVIATAPGAEGLDVIHGETIQIAGADAASWIAAVRTLESADRRSRMIQQARERVCLQYDWAAIGARLAETYQDWVAAAVKSRAESPHHPPARTRPESA